MLEIECDNLLWHGRTQVRCIVVVWWRSQQRHSKHHSQVCKCHLFVFSLEFVFSLFNELAQQPQQTPVRSRHGLQDIKSVAHLKVALVCDFSTPKRHRKDRIHSSPVQHSLFPRTYFVPSSPHCSSQECETTLLDSNELESFESSFLHLQRMLDAAS